MTIASYAFLILYFIFSGIHLADSWKDDAAARKKTKPFLLIFLILFYVTAARAKGGTEYHLLLALITSWLGDVLLIPKGHHWFALVPEKARTGDEPDRGDEEDQTDVLDDLQCFLDEGDLRNDEVRFQRVIEKRAVDEGDDEDAGGTEADPFDGDAAEQIAGGEDEEHRKGQIGDGLDGEQSQCHKDNIPFSNFSNRTRTWIVLINGLYKRTPSFSIELLTFSHNYPKMIKTT